MKTKIIGKATLHISSIDTYMSFDGRKKATARCMADTHDGCYHNEVTIPLPLVVYQYIQDNQHIIGQTITIQFVDELKKETVKVK